MPYASNDELPQSVRNAIPSEEGRDIFRGAFNAAFDEGEPESVAFAVAWQAVDAAGFEQDEDGQWVAKRQLSDDQFTTSLEARARAQALNLGDTSHVHEDADGNAVYMPGESHDVYVAAAALDFPRMSSDNPPQHMNSNPALSGANEGIVGELVDRLRAALFGVGKSEEPAASRSSVSADPSAAAPVEQDFRLEGEILKKDESERIVWGWATVVTKNGELVTDLQGDVILPDEMERFATEYMLDSRVGKDMHAGDPTSITVHSFPLTKQLAEAFGIQCDCEGWIIAQKVVDDAAWAAIMSGERMAFSIGGVAVSLDIDEEAA